MGVGVRSVLGWMRHIHVSQWDIDPAGSIQPAGLSQSPHGPLSSAVLGNTTLQTPSVNPDGQLRIDQSIIGGEGP